MAAKKAKPYPYRRYPYPSRRSSKYPYPSRYPGRYPKPVQAAESNHSKNIVPAGDNYCPQTGSWY